MKRASDLQGLHVHFEPVSGIAGDMAVAALVDAGVPSAVVTEAIDALGVPGLSTRFERRTRGAYVARGFVVKAPVPLDGAPLAGSAHAHEEGDHEHSHHDHEHAHHDHGHAHRDHDHEPEARVPPRERRQRRATKRPGRGAAHAHAHHRFADIRRLIRRARLDADAKALAEDIFFRLAEVEGALHGRDVADVTFHEVGAYDSIADIVGVAAAIAWLAPASIGSTPPVVGTGVVRTAHGLVPVPAPATAALLVDAPVIADGEGELTTPTGAAILAATVDAWGAPPPLVLAANGYGAGTKELADRANVLRVLIGKPIGEPFDEAPPPGAVWIVESNLDNMNPELVPPLFDALFAAGALDVWSSAITMKKGRLGQMVAAMVAESERPAVQEAFFRHSSTLGVRFRRMERAVLPRRRLDVDTPFGVVGVKIGGLDGEPISAQPELEDCRRRAAAAEVPVRQVWTAAFAAAQDALRSPTEARRRRAFSSATPKATKAGAPPLGGKARARKAKARAGSPPRRSSS